MDLSNNYTDARYKGTPRSDFTFYKMLEMTIDNVRK